MPGPSAGTGTALILGALGGIVAIYLAHAWLFRHYVNDDAYVTFRYSRHLVEGLGPYFNPGERVEGYTNLLLMLLLVPVIALGGPEAAPPAAKAIGIGSGVAGILLAWALGRALDGGRAGARAGVAGLAAAGLVAVAPSYAVNSTSGLETTLFGALLAAGALLALRAEAAGRWRGSGLAFAAAALTRPEGALLFGAHWLAQVGLAAGSPAALVRRLRRDGLRGVPARRLGDAGLVAGAVAAQLVFRLAAYDGEWLPNTYHAKAGGFWGFGAWAYIHDGLGMPLGGWLGLAAAGLGWLLSRDGWGRAAPAAAIAVTGALLPLVVGTDWMPGQRLLMPILPLAAVLVAIGWCRLATRVIPRPAWLPPALALAAAAALGFLQAPARAALHLETSVRARGYLDGHAALARWLCATETAPGDTIALMDIGLVGYRCDDRIILDVTGLTDRAIGRSPGTFLDKRYDVGYVLARRPRAIVLVLTRSGDPTRPLPDAPLDPWTRVDLELYRHPEFQRWYRRRDEAPAAGEDRLDGLARRLGAARVFQHAYPGRYYLLAAFRRLEAPNP